MRWKLAAAFVPLGLAATGLTAHRWMTRVRKRGMSRARAEAEEGRRRSLRRLDHELKNPLTAIQVGQANLAEPDTEQARLATLASVQAQVLRIARLAADLRKLAELGTRSPRRSVWASPGCRSDSSRAFRDCHATACSDIAPAPIVPAQGLRGRGASHPGYAQLD